MMKHIRHLTVHDFSFQNTTEKKLSLEDVFNRVQKFIGIEPFGDFRFMIGTDSHVYRNHTTFVTGIVIQRMGKGVWACYRKDKEHHRMEFRDKITKETELTQHIASYFDESKVKQMTNILEQGSTFTNECHLDIGMGKRNKTSIFVDEMIKVIESIGYKPQIKPYSFVASHYANYYTKLG